MPGFFVVVFGGKQVSRSLGDPEACVCETEQPQVLPAAKGPLKTALRCDWWQKPTQQGA